MNNSREQALYSLGEGAIENIKSKAIDAGDLSMLQTIHAFQCQNAVMFYHPICKILFETKCKNSRPKEQTEWHLTRDKHKNAFRELFVTFY